MRCGRGKKEEEHGKQTGRKSQVLARRERTSAAAGLATTMLANQVQQYVPLQEDYFPAQEDYTSVYEDYASNYASQFSLSSNLSPLERELFYRQSYNNALKSSPSFKEEGGFLDTLLKILFG